MRVVLGLVLLASVACFGCQGGDCSCINQGVSIVSSTPDLVGASGCGHAASCTSGAPCDTLFLSPPGDGGVCTVGVLFADGGTQIVTADFGAVHHSTGCCGDFFDHPDITINVQ